MEQLNIHAPMKENIIRANNAPFMNKTLSTAFMTRSRLRNRFLKNPNKNNEVKFKKHRNFCVNLLKREKRKYYNSLYLKKITDNRQFWKTIKPLFSEKQNFSRRITLMDGDNIISNDADVAKTMNICFSTPIKNLEIMGYHGIDENITNLDPVHNAVNKFQNHLSILKIKSRVETTDTFTFSLSTEQDIINTIHGLNTKKLTTFNNIPAKIIVENNDICAPLSTKILNNSKLLCTFPSALKMADITPAHKKDEKSNKDNYRPISILPSISKIFEKDMYEQIIAYIETHLSQYLCGFRKGYCTQHCLILMLEKWRKALDKRNIAGALLTDLSKAFDCLNHELLIAKLEAYGFDHSSLDYIYSYLSNRRQRTKVNNSFSSWHDIKSGVPQGSIIGPLIFNIHLNDIFYFVSDSNLTNYADDNTPYSISSNVNDLIESLVNDTSTVMVQ